MPNPPSDAQPIHRQAWAWLTLVSAQPIDPLALDAGDLDAWRRIGIEVDGRGMQGDVEAVQLYLDHAGHAIAHHLGWRLVPDFAGDVERAARAGEMTIVWLGDRGQAGPAGHPSARHLRTPGRFRRAVSPRDEHALVSPPVQPLEARLIEIRAQYHLGVLCIKQSPLQIVVRSLLIAGAPLLVADVAISHGKLQLITQVVPLAVVLAIIALVGWWSLTKAASIERELEEERMRHQRSALDQ